MFFCFITLNLSSYNIRSFVNKFQHRSNSAPAPKLHDFCQEKKNKKGCQDGQKTSVFKAKINLFFRLRFLQKFIRNHGI